MNDTVIETNNSDPVEPAAEFTHDELKDKIKEYIKSGFSVSDGHLSASGVLRCGSIQCCNCVFSPEGIICNYNNYEEELIRLIPEEFM